MSISVKDFSYLEVRGLASEFLELRIENDVNGNPVYIGYSKFANADTASAIWFIKKITYDGNQSPTYQQLSDLGLQFACIWDNRSTYF